MRITEYVVPLGENVRKRHYHEADRGKVVSFVVQLEALVQGQWRVVLRYDSAHGFSHLDRYFLDGRKIKRELFLDLDEALVLADEDIKENWRAYHRAYMGVDK